MPPPCQRGRDPMCLAQKREKAGDGTYELYNHNQRFLGFGHDESIVYRAGVAILCIAACMQQEQLDRVVPSAESSAFRTGRTFEVRNTEGEK